MMILYSSEKGKKRPSPPRGGEEGRSFPFFDQEAPKLPERDGKFS